MGMFDQRGNPTDLVKEHGGEAREMFQKNYFGQGAPNIRPVDMKHVELPNFIAEFVVKGEDLILHFYKNDDKGWPSDFRSRMWNALMETFKLQDHQDRIVIEWIPELFSWCVTVKKMAIVSAPPDDVVLTALQRVG